MDFKNNKVVVLGLGESGRAATELLLDKEIEVIVKDTMVNEKKRELANLLISKGARVSFDDSFESFDRPDCFVVSPGLDPRSSLFSNANTAFSDIPVFAEIEMASSFCRKPIIGITGTNGKSTTTELIASLLNQGGQKTVACGNIGLPFSDLIRKEYDRLDVFVIELSSFQLETISDFKPDIAVYLNFSPDHLDRYDSIESYREAKNRIFCNQTDLDYAVVSVESGLKKLHAKTVTISAYGAEAEYTFENGFLCCRGEKVLAQKETKLSGLHNAENQLAALAVADLRGVSRENSIEVLQSYQPLRHRCEWVRTFSGVNYINDSKATNIDSLNKALLGKEGPLILIAGGKDKGFDFSVLQQVIQEKVKHAILIGEVKEKMELDWETKTTCHLSDSLESAVVLSHRLACEEGIEEVLFSPGCSSYDMFKSFEERGDQFCQAVNRLK